MLEPTELFDRMRELHALYRAALAEHNLGRAGIVQSDVGTLVCQNWETILAALERWTSPLSYGAEPDSGRGGQDA